MRAIEPAQTTSPKDNGVIKTIGKVGNSPGIISGAALREYEIPIGHVTRE